MALADLAYLQFLGKPLIFWGGITSICLLLITALIPYLGRKKIIKNHFKVHKYFAYTTVVVAVGHGIFAISVYIG